MHRASVLLTLTALLGFAPFVRGQEPHAEFVRALRERYGPALAEEYLQRLRKNPPRVADPALDLESARTKLDFAQLENNAADRLRLFREAQAAVDGFLAKNPTHPQAGEAQLIAIQVLSQQGRALYHKALRQGSFEAQQAEAGRARAMLETAAKRLATTLTRFDAELAKIKPDTKVAKERDTRKRLEEQKLRAEFDLGLNLFDQALTYLDASKIEILQKRNAILKDAIAQLEKVAGREPRNPLCCQAKAWVGRAYQEQDDVKKAQARYREVLDEGPYADPAKMLARYFRLLPYLPVLEGRTGPQPGEDVFGLTQNQGESWLTAFPGFVNSPEGQGVRYLLALSYYQEAKTKPLSQDRKDRAYARAAELLREVERGNSEFAERARGRKLDVSVAQLGGNPASIVASTDLATLKTFDQLYLHAQLLASLVTEEAGKPLPDAKANQERQQERFKRLIGVLAAAVPLAQAPGADVAPEELQNARLMLAYSYLMSGDLARAIATAEALAYEKTPTNQGPAAAIYAVQAYRQLLARPGAEADVKSYRDRLRKLAEHMVKTWPGELAADVGRQQLAALLLDERKLPEAIELLAGIRPEFPGAILAQYQLAVSAFQADTEKLTPSPTDPDKRPWAERGRAALENLPPLSPEADPSTAQSYVQAKVYLGRLYFREKKFDQMEALAKPLLDGVEKKTLPLSDEARKELLPGLVGLSFYGIYGKADKDYREGKYPEVRKLLDPLIERVGRDPAAKELLKRDAPLKNAVLGMALRANIEEGRGKEAAAILLLSRDLPSDGPPPTSAAVLEPVMDALIQALDELQTKGKKDDATKAAARLVGFLDEVGNQVKEQTPEFLSLLGRSYARLDGHVKAADLLKKIAEPKTDDARLQALYQDARVLLIQELRLADKAAEAEKVLEAVETQPWAKDRVEVQKERLHVLDRQGKYLESSTGWNKVVNQLANRMSDPRKRDLYFESYFNLVKSYYLYGQGLEEAKKAEIAKKAAGFIVRLEAAWPTRGGEASNRRFAELLEKEKPLKEQYDSLKKK